MPLPIIILGGGPCGLSAAWELALAGQNVIVLEQEANVGGLCGTVEHEGFRFDFGGHRFISDDPVLTERICALMGDDFLIQERKSVVLFKQKFYDYPLKPLNLIQNLGIWTNFRAFWDYFWAKFYKAKQNREEASFESWVTHHFGQTLCRLFFGPYTEKLWGIPASQISKDWAAQRISLLNLSDVALRLFGLRKSPVRTYAKQYFYPKFGMGQLYQKMKTEIEAHGGKIHLNARVEALETSQNRVVQVRYKNQQKTETLPCAYVISTIALPDLVRLVAPACISKLKMHLDGLAFRPLRFLTLFLNKSDFSNNTWIYVSDPASFISRIQEPKRRSPYLSPEGKTSIMLEIPCSVGDLLWEMPESDLLETSLQDLLNLGFDLRQWVIGSASRRVRHGYPIYTLAYKTHRDHLLNELSRFENLISCGRQGVFRYIFMDTAMNMGIEAARQIIQGAAFDREKIYFLKSEPELLEAKAITASA